ncbi:hypothetical protein F2Q69_00017993 [Brassica cretica]|uniref:Protein ENDOSPERM DEFECTIVE 1 n=1 Tax=Brassica cretica TaxID=69181 RepID=A0A8S9R7M5_BRACR|nr:hypothetical protein F2Q69_00017993 [Brassica cretica]
METRTGQSTPGITAPVPAPLPPPSTRRPRVREVSSRFMSPVASSSSSGYLHLPTSNSPRHNQRSISTQKPRRPLKLTEGDENRPPETAARGLDSPFPLDGGKNQQRNRSKPSREENGHRHDTPPTLTLPSSAAARLLRLSVSTDGEEEDSDREKLNDDDTPSFRASLLVKNGVGLSLPPVAPNLKSQGDTKRRKRVLGQQADAHSLKLLRNRYLQWRFANANADVRKQAHKAEAERMFCSLGLKMSELSHCVRKKRIELQGLMRVKAVKEIVEPQMPLLEQWTTLEEEYSTSLSETSGALLNASLRLPLDADIKVETKELGEVLAVASKSMEGIVQSIGQFLPKTQEIESLLSELARVSSREKVAAEDCGVALLKTHSSHVEDCYLRSQLIQQHHKQCEADETDAVEANKNKGNAFRR